mmetsp:Transcript_17647/g.48742  ORF Transcript_17647/g.48742 Transcript_17647/m.48742 type:complete len:211 (-) Transcript_17647:1363-1995(-)
MAMTLAFGRKLHAIPWPSSSLHCFRIAFLHKGGEAHVELHQVKYSFLLHRHIPPVAVNALRAGLKDNGGIRGCKKGRNRVCLHCDFLLRLVRYPVEGIPLEAPYASRALEQVLKHYPILPVRDQPRCTKCVALLSTAITFPSLAPLLCNEPATLDVLDTGADELPRPDNLQLHARLLVVWVDRHNVVVFPRHCAAKPCPEILHFALPDTI